GANSVSVLDTATQAVVASVAVTGAPAGVAAGPGGRHVYVTGPEDRSVQRIDVATRTVDLRRTVGDGPVGIAAASDKDGGGVRVFVADWYGNRLLILDGATLATLAEVPVGTAPAGVAVASRRGLVLVANRDDDSVSVVDGDRVTATIPV